MKLVEMCRQLEFGVSEYIPNWNEVSQKLARLSRLNLKEDDENTEACEIITFLVDIDEIKNFIFKIMEDDWQHNELYHCSKPTKHDFIWYYVWDTIAFEQKAPPYNR